MPRWAAALPEADRRAFTDMLARLVEAGQVLVEV